MSLQQISLNIYDIITTKIHTGLSLSYNDMQDAPLTLYLDAIAMTYLLLEVQKYYSVNFTEDLLLNYSFNSINKIAISTEYLLLRNKYNYEINEGNI